MGEGDLTVHQETPILESSRKAAGTPMDEETWNLLKMQIMNNEAIITKLKQDIALKDQLIDKFITRVCHKPKLSWKRKIYKRKMNCV